MIKKKYFICIIWFISCFSTELYGQANEYQEANRLFEQQQYEKALPLFEELYNNNVRSLVFFRKYVDSLIGLKRFNEAETVVRDQLQHDRFRLQASMKLAELIHLDGREEDAKERWLAEAEQHSNNIQAIYLIGSSIVERQEYAIAAEVYELARDQINDETIFLNELANVYMLAGNFEKSVRIYFQLIIESPDQMGLVQQRFLRMQDIHLYEIASYELEDVLLDLDHTHIAYSPLYQLLVWLLMETEEYQRAFVVARQFENQSTYTIYSLFSLGNQLRSAQQFEIAVQAFEYYLDNANESLKNRAMEEMGTTYQAWGDYLSENQLYNYSVHHQYFVHAYEMFEKIIHEFPEYNRIDYVYSSIIDLSLDHFKDYQQASSWFNLMTENPDLQRSAFAYYTEGRLALFNSDFALARQLLTRADKNTESSNLSERARFYLSLSDIFAGDYEFAEIQLRSLERRNTSFFSNDAIKLRMWIKNGSRIDSTGNVLKTVGQSLHALQMGDYSNTLHILEPILNSPSHIFADDLSIELKNELPPDYYPLLYPLINQILNAQPESALKERLLWDKITLSEYFLNGNGSLSPTISLDFQFFDVTETPDISQSEFITLLEDFLIEFPDGFYAPYVREKLQHYTNIST